MDVSKNREPPQSSILIGFSILNHPFWGPTPIFGNTQIQQKLTIQTLTSKHPLPFTGSFLQDFHICHIYTMFLLSGFRSQETSMATKLNFIQKSTVYVVMCLFLSWF